MKPGVVAWRIYQDFLMPSRMLELRGLLQSALDSGYRFVTLSEYADLRASGQPLPDTPLFVLRHDIDTDPLTAARMVEMEVDLGVRATYFLRRRTFAESLVRTLDSTDMEVGYHYEEIADDIKKSRILDSAVVMQRLPQIRKTFLANITQLRQRFGLALSTAASHGDWANRRLNITNNILLADPVFRSAAAIRHEAYDDLLCKDLAFRASDTDLPAYWRPSSPKDAIAAGLSPVYLLIHPRQWVSSVRANLPEIALRVREGFVYRSGLGW